MRSQRDRRHYGKLRVLFTCAYVSSCVLRCDPDRIVMYPECILTHRYNYNTYSDQREHLNIRRTIRVRRVESEN